MAREIYVVLNDAETDLFDKLRIYQAWLEDSEEVEGFELLSMSHAYNGFRWSIVVTYKAPRAIEGLGGIHFR